MTMFDLIDDGAQFAAQLHTNSKQVHTTDNLTYPYDYLIVAAGARHSYFGDDESEAFAPGLKNLEDVIPRFSPHRSTLGPYLAIGWRAADFTDFFPRRSFPLGIGPIGEYGLATEVCAPSALGRKPLRLKIQNLFQNIYLERFFQ
jgi:hypothetical protein